jgi:hypothetical protein
MPDITPRQQLELAKSHLERVQVASWAPVDWADVGNYGLYALEAAVMAASRQLGIVVKAAHWAKADAAVELAEKHGLPSVDDLMARLNETRKASNYGDVEAPDLDAEDVASAIEEFLSAVEDLLDTDEE